VGTELIDISEFARVDLRVGIVKHAERVPGSKKLIRLVVNLGSEERQVIAGLAEFYEPSTLVGKYVIVVANLKPKRMMGLESQGMILAAGCGPNEKPVILTTLEPVPPGTKVC